MCIMEVHNYITWYILLGTVGKRGGGGGLPVVLVQGNHPGF